VIRAVGVVSRILPSALALLGLVTVVARAAGAESKQWTVVAGKSQVSFDASHALGNFSGRGEDVTGVFAADPADLRRGVTGVLRVNAATLKTGDPERDRDMRTALAVERHPEIRFTIEQIEASFPSVSDRSDVLLTISGRLLIRGVERPMEFPARVRRRDDGLWVRGEAKLKMTDFGITPPKRLFVRVADDVLVSFDVVLTEEAETPARSSSPDRADRHQVFAQ